MTLDRQANRELRESQARLDHIYRVLLGIRNVNQLIVSEDDPQRLIERACENLTETMGYGTAWIALLEEGAQQVRTVAASCADGAFSVLHQRLAAGEFPTCMARALRQEGTVVVDDPARDCPGCPLSPEPGGSASLCRRLIYGGKTYGVMTVYTSAAYVHDEEAQDLFDEVADDLAFALQKIEVARRLDDSRAMLERTERIAGVGSWEWDVGTDRVRWSDELFRIFGLEPAAQAPSFAEHRSFYVPEDRKRLAEAVEACVEHGTAYELEVRLVRTDGKTRHCVVRGLAQRGSDGAVERLVGSLQDVTEIRRAEEALKKIEWMLTPKPTPADAGQAVPHEHDYGDLTDLNRDGSILKSIGHERLRSFANDYLELLGTSSAIYESNGDYAFGIFASGWCRMMDCASRRLCETSDNAEALNSGRWLCHESCWTDCSKRAIDESAPVDIECSGGIRMYAVPILAHQKVVGAINFGYGDPPTDPEKLLKLAEAYRLDYEDLVREANGYDSRPPFVIELAKKRLHATARLIGSMIETKNAEQALRHSHDLMRYIIEHTNSAVAVHDRDLRYVYVSERYLRDYGVQEQDVIGKHHYDVFPDLPEKWREVHRKALAGEVCRSERDAYEHADGAVDWTRWECRPWYETDGSIGGIIVYTEVITEHVAAEQALQASETRYRSLFECAQDGILILDAETGEVVDVNPYLLQLLGHDRGALVGKPLWDIGPFHDIAASRDLFRVLQEKEYVRYEHLPLQSASGEPVAVEFVSNVYLAGGTEVIQCNIRDITDRKRAEEALREKRDRLDYILKASRLGTWVWNIKENTAEFNELWATLLGYTMDEIGPSSYELWKSLGHPDDVPKIEALLQQCANGERFDYSSEFRMRHKDGHWVWILDRGRVMTHDAEGRPLEMFGTHADITERKQTEDALRASEEKFRSIFASMTEIVVLHELVCDEDGRPANYRILDCNLAFTQITGISREDAVGRLATDVYGSDSAPYLDQYARVALTGEPCTFITDYAPIDKHLEIRVASLGKNMFVTVTNDITERRRAEQTLQESESRVRAKLNALLDPDGDLDTLHLADVVDCDEIQSLMDDFHALTDIGVGIIDLEGNVLVRAGWQDVCTAFHRVHPETAKNCRESDTVLASGVAPGTFKAYKCKNNLWDMVTPIMVGERRVGNLFLGQFLFDDEEPDIDVFRDQAHRYGFDEDAYLKAYDGVPRWSRQTVDRVMTFYCNLVGVISRLSYAQIKLARASESLRHSEQRFRSFVENANDMVYALSPEGLFTYMSPNWLGFMGEPADHVIGKFFEPYIHPEDVHLCRGFLEKVLTTGEKQGSVEYRVRHRDGSWRWHVSNGSPVRDESGTVTGYIGIARDMTEAKRAEQALEESEERFRTLFESLSAGSCIDEIIYDEHGKAVDYRILDVNRSYEKTMGIDREGVIGRLGSEVYGLDRAPFLDTLARVAETGEPAHFESYFEPIGRHLEFTVSRPAQGLFSTVFSDITDRKQAEAEAARLMSAVEQAGEVFVIADLEGNIQYVNPAFERVTGYRRQEVLGQNPRILKSGEHDEAFYRDLWDTLTRGQTWRGRFVNRRKDGSHYTEEAVISPVRDAEGKTIHYAAVKRDITERLNTSAMLAQAQKMESVGRLAGGVAHDFNNMLGVILGYADLALAKLSEDHPLCGKLTKIRDAALRSADLTRQLLAFARRQTIAPKVLDLNEAVGPMIGMMRRLIGENIELVWTPAEELPPVFVDPAQVDQVLANLTVNARDAIDGVGRIVIETGRFEMDRDYCATHAGTVPGHYVVLSVSDDGRGMDEATRQNIFEPFFTTKPLGEGTGLGLATVYGIVKQNKGYVTVYSEPQHGSTFRVYLPVHEGPTTERIDADLDAAPPEGGSETVLLVEDEPAILDLAQKMLEGLGYEVLAFSSPLEALRFVRDRGVEIDLLLTDVVMPEMNGRDLAMCLAEACPQAASLFVSGYTADVIARQGVLDKGVRFLQKPFSTPQLARAVRQALDRPPAK